MASAILSPIGEPRNIKRSAQESSIDMGNRNKKPKFSAGVQQQRADESIIRWDHDEEESNSRLQLVWDSTMQEGKQYMSTKCYKEVHVLMISWDEPGDDLKVQKEIRDLGTVFRDVYNYQVHQETLSNNTNKLPRHQCQKFVTDFVIEYDHPKALLIVYFAGHGTSAERSGQLELHGSVDLVRAHRNGIIWSHTEGALRGTEADVLQIFDCCYSGGDLVHRGNGLRLYEYLAATEFSTPGPGETSFTSALIFALKKLAREGGRFTSSDLLRTITKDAPNFPHDQKPVLSKPDSNHREFIVIEPLPKKGSGDSRCPDLSPMQSEHVAPQDILTLRVIFENRPTEEIVKALGEHTNLMVERLSHSMDDFRVNRITWGGLQSWGRDHRVWTRDPVIYAAHRFLMLRKGTSGDDGPAPNPSNEFEDSCT